MITLTIDNQKTQVPPDSTILQAAQTLGIRIPTLCYAEGFKPSTSCMVCVVQVEGVRNLVPACAIRVTENMVVTTCSDEIQAARKTAIELLLSDHVGDCLGPCQKGCPANMNIPRMIRQIASGQLGQAIATVKQDISLPAILGRICSAPCEKVCRRAQADGAVSICQLKRYVADVDLASAHPWRPECQPSTGKKVAIVGAGPCGLSAAYYLSQAGIDCTLMDRRNRPGGALLDDDIDRQILPLDVVENEIKLIFDLNVAFQGGITLGTDVQLKDMAAQYDAVLLTVGDVDSNTKIGIEVKENKIAVNRPDYATSKENVFAAGTCIGSRKIPIRALADGKEAARSIQSRLLGTAVSGDSAYNHRMGRLEDDQMQIFLKHAAGHERTEIQDMTAGLTETQASQESLRCLHCDCRKADHCQLRDLATEFGARQKAFDAPGQLFEQILGHEKIIFEPGKCIKCGVCVQVAKKSGEKLGLSFEGRGFQMRIAVPLTKDFVDGLQKSAKECAEKCPTGAISMNQ